MAVLEFSWQREDNGLRLTPASNVGSRLIEVKKVNDYFEIHVGNCPMNARYTSEQGAKLDAWQFAHSKRKALFGAYRIKLCA
jgi:hypothetical protein